jgi:hypothetical protein
LEYSVTGTPLHKAWLWIRMLACINRKLHYIYIFFKNEFIYSCGQNWGGTNSQSVLTFPIAGLELTEKMKKKPGNLHL